MTQTIPFNLLDKIILALKQSPDACSMLNSCKYVGDVLEKAQYTQYWLDAATGKTVAAVCKNIHAIQLVINVYYADFQ